jgi:hypothetical protein
LGTSPRATLSGRAALLTQEGVALLPNMASSLLEPGTNRNRRSATTFYLTGTCNGYRQRQLFLGRNQTCDSCGPVAAAC